MRILIIFTLHILSTFSFIVYSSNSNYTKLPISISLIFNLSRLIHSWVSQVFLHATFFYILILHLRFTIHQSFQCNLMFSPLQKRLLNFSFPATTISTELNSQIPELIHTQFSNTQTDATLIFHLSKTSLTFLWIHFQHPPPYIIKETYRFIQLILRLTAQYHLYTTMIAPICLTMI